MNPPQNRLVGQTEAGHKVVHLQSQAPHRGSLAHGFRVQMRSIGAVMLRELHTRFGRNNIGYLWLVLEPMILSGGIAATHLLIHAKLPYGFQPGSFYSSGYITYIAMRNNVNRSAGLIESNKPLLYHRNVTLQDISWARTALEGLAVLGAMIVILTVYVLLGLSAPPQRPFYILLGLTLMTWLSGGLAMIITGLSEMSPLVERLVHPITYLMIPISGMFFILDELPPKIANIVKWTVFSQITDISRMGLRSEFNSSYVNYGFIILVSAVSTLLGILLLVIARRRMHFE